MKPEVIEEYGDEPQPAYCKRMVEDQLRCVPEKYMNGLQYIKLRNGADQHPEDHNGKKHAGKYNIRDKRLHRLYGYYQPAQHDQLPFIVIYVDRINLLPGGKSQRETLMDRLFLPFLTRNSMRLGLGNVVFRGIHHHMEKTKHPEVENNSARKLRRHYFYRRWYLFIPIIPFAFITSLWVVLWYTPRRGRKRT